jgi:outer membrane usher protein
VELNPQDGGDYEARADFFGPGVMPELTSYRFYDLHLALPGNRPGFQLQRENYTLLPTYKSGFRIPVGTDATVFARGTLLGADSQLVALRSGEVRSLTEPQAEPRILFTNRGGRFGLEGLKPGRYLLQLFGNERDRFEFEIPERSLGMVELGAVKMAGANQ